MQLKSTTVPSLPCLALCIFWPSILSLNLLSQPSLRSRQLLQRPRYLHFPRLAQHSQLCPWVISDHTRKKETPPLELGAVVWSSPIIPATWEAEVGGWQVGGQAGQLGETMSQNKRAGSVTPSMWEAMGSILQTAKPKQNLPQVKPHHCVLPRL